MDASEEDEEFGPRCAECGDVLSVSFVVHSELVCDECFEKLGPDSKRSV